MTTNHGNGKEVAQDGGLPPVDRSRLLAHIDRTIRLMPTSCPKTAAEVLGHLRNRIAAGAFVVDPAPTQGDILDAVLRTTLENLAALGATAIPPPAANHDCAQCRSASLTGTLQQSIATLWAEVRAGRDDPLTLEQEQRVRAILRQEIRDSPFVVDGPGAAAIARWIAKEEIDRALPRAREGQALEVREKPATIWIMNPAAIAYAYLEAMGGP